MNLIGRNQIVDYIKNHPEAKTPLLLWLMEFIYIEHDRIFMWQRDPASVVGKGYASIEKGEYIVRYKTNNPAKAVCITWLGNEDAFKEVMQEEMKEAEQQAEMLGEEIVTAEISITPPRPVEKKYIQQAVAKPVRNPVYPQLNKSEHSLPAVPEELIISPAHIYKEALNKTIGNFEAAPGSAAFEELNALLPAVSHYEFKHLDLPVIKASEIVAHRMEVFEMGDVYFASIAGSPEKWDNFLAGKKMLPLRVLGRIYKALGIRLPAAETYNFSL
jgi:antitoxin component HigA of HigAB toxin-antitoxin module